MTMTIIRTGGTVAVRFGPAGVAAGAAVISTVALGAAFYEYAESPNYWLCRYRIPCDRFSSGPLDARPFSAIACHLRENDMKIAGSMHDMGFIDTWGEYDPDEIRTGLVYYEPNCDPMTCGDVDFAATFGDSGEDGSGFGWTEEDYVNHGIEPGTSCVGCHDSSWPFWSEDDYQNHGISPDTECAQCHDLLSEDEEETFCYAQNSGGETWLGWTERCWAEAEFEAHGATVDACADCHGDQPPEACYYPDGTR
jgi:hypothetical protein